MVIIDANAILRYILLDNVKMAEKVEELLSEHQVYCRYEVIAEVVYVLDKVYALSRKEIAEGIKLFFEVQNVETESLEVLLVALETYAKIKLDFVDCLLYGFRAVNKDTVFSFDKKLKAMMDKLE